MLVQSVNRLAHTIRTTGRIVKMVATTTRPTTAQAYKEGFQDALGNILIQMEEVKFYKPHLVEEHLRDWIQRHIQAFNKTPET